MSFGPLSLFMEVLLKSVGANSYKASRGRGSPLTLSLSLLDGGCGKVTFFAVVQYTSKELARAWQIWTQFGTGISIAKEVSADKA